MNIGSVDNKATYICKGVNVSFIFDVKISSKIKLVKS